MKGRSSTFSHLCTQADTAAEMFLQHAPARDELLVRIAERAQNSACEDAALNVTAALEDRRPDAVTVTLRGAGSRDERGHAHMLAAAEGHNSAQHRKPKEQDRG